MNVRLFVVESEEYSYRGRRMKCHSCGTEVQIQQGFCPSCGTFIGMPGEMLPSGRKSHFWILLSGLLLFVLLIAVVPAWLLWKYGLFRERPRVLNGPAIVKQQHVPAKLSELHGEGEVYFVPLGKQAVAPESLVQHYKSKFNLTIHLLPALSLDAKTYDRERKQYIAEELVEQMKRAYPDLAKDPESFMIGLTDADIYMRTNDWEFTHSYRKLRHFAVVSSRRMEDTDSPSLEQTELRTRQMITKDIAVLYYQLPISADPESVLYQPFTPDGRPDDIWESDVHPEDSAYGLEGEQLCLIITYSYRTRTMRFDPGGLSCERQDDVVDRDLETFLIYPKTGYIALYKTDFDLPGKPPIVFQRINYLGDKVIRAFGIGVEHSYNSFTSSGPATAQELKIFYAETQCYCTPEFVRVAPDRQLSPDTVFEGEEQGDYYNSRMTWDGHQCVLKLMSGETYTYLPSSGNVFCYENGYTDAENHKLVFTRNPALSLISLASQNASLTLSYDARLRISDIQDQSGNKARYEYDDAGYLSKVTTSDGFVTNYKYSSDRRSFNVSTADQSHSETSVFGAEFDDAHRISKAIMPDGGVYRFQYGLAGNEVNSALVIFPDGKKLRIRFHGFSFVAHSEK